MPVRERGAVVLLALLASTGDVWAKELSWTVAGHAQTLTVGPAAESAVGVTLTLPGGHTHEAMPDDREGAEDESSTSLLSAVGPMVSRFHDGAGYHGAGGWVDQQIEVELRASYRFSMSRFLRAQGLLLGVDPDEIDRFWIISWDGLRVTVGVQTEGCVNRRSTCQIAWQAVTVIPPAEWLPWLDAARSGHGAMQADLGRLWRELPAAELSAARAHLATLRDEGARRAYLQSLHAPVSAARLLEESFPFATAPFEQAETQRAWADRLGFLAETPFPDHPAEEGACARVVAEIVGKTWQRGPGRDALGAAETCLRTHALDGWLMAFGSEKPDPKMRACAQATAPMSCAAPRLHEALRGYASVAITRGAWKTLPELQALAALDPLTGCCAAHDADTVVLLAAAEHGDDAAIAWSLGLRAFPPETLLGVLNAAAARGNLALAKATLARGVDPGSADGALRAALSTNHLEVARLLWPSGTLDPGQLRWLLTAAADAENSDAMELILGRAPALGNVPEAGSVLDEALAHHQWHSAELLVRHGLPSDALQGDAAAAACAEVDAPVVSYFVDHGLSLSSNCLTQAVLAGRLELARALIDRGAKVNNDAYGLTPLRAAIKIRRLDLVKLLVEHGAPADLSFVDSFLHDHADDDHALAAIRAYLAKA